MAADISPITSSSKPVETEGSIPGKSKETRSVEVQTDTLSSHSESDPTTTRKGVIFLIVSAIIAGILGAIGFFFSLFKREQEPSTELLDQQKNKLDEILEKSPKKSSSLPNQKS